MDENMVHVVRLYNLEKMLENIEGWFGGKKAASTKFRLSTPKGKNLVLPLINRAHGIFDPVF